MNTSNCLLALFTFASHEIGENKVMNLKNERSRSLPTGEGSGAFMK